MKIERRTIDFIPEQERHGSPSDLFTFWFGASVNMTTLVIGALLIGLGLNLFWSTVAIVLGIASGTVFVASHSVQGPRLGIPQMIQSRAQFGVYGAIIPMLFVVFIYLGYSVANTLIVYQGLADIVPLGRATIVVLFSLAMFLIALYGYRLIHGVQRWLAYASILGFALVFIIILQNPPPASLWQPEPTALSLILAGIGLTATFTLSYAPYVADFSRYLPSQTSSAKVFWCTYAGFIVSLSMTMLLGAMLAALIPSYMDNSAGNLANLFGPYAPVLYALIVVGLLCANILNLYGAFMAIVTTIQSFRNWAISTSARAAILLVVACANIAMSVPDMGDFSNLFLNFIFLMSYALIPWTAINLVDYYILRQGRYSVADIFDPDGIYGRWNHITIFAFFLAILVQIPFIATGFYTGPIAQALGGIDLAWLVGIIVGAAAYYFPMRARLTRRAAI